MSAPETNIEKQQQRHYGPLWGMGVVLIIVAIGVVLVPALTEEVSEEASTITASQSEVSQ